VITRMLGHVRHNTVAYLALVFSVIGGGGGYAVAATTHHGTAKKSKKTAIVACASNKTGELFLHKRGKCARGRHQVRWSVRGPKGAAGAAGATGAPAPSIFAAVDANLAANGQQGSAEKGMTVARTGLGLYAATITDPVCSQSTNNVPTVTATDTPLSGTLPPSGATPTAFLDSNVGITSSFTVHVGYIAANGAFTPQDYSFNVEDTCVPSSSSAAADK
jgi:hypothetical protein